MVATHYIDPLNGNNGGAGSLAAPWLDWTNVANVGLCPDGDTVLVIPTAALAAGLALTSRANLTFGVYGAGTVNVQGGAAACLQFTSCTGIVVDHVEASLGDRGVGMYGTGGSVTVRWCVLHDNVLNGTDTDSSTSGTMLVEDTIAYNNGTGGSGDGFSVKGSVAQDLWRCEAYGHTGGANTSDGVTAHDTNVQTLHDCYIHDNDDGWNPISTAAGSYAERCRFIGNTEVGANFGGATAVTYTLKNCIIQMTVQASSTHSCVQATQSATVEMYFCTFRNPNTGATTNHCLYTSSASARLGWKNCRFLSASDNDARYVRVASTGASGNVLFADYNHYQDTSGFTKFNVPGNTAFSAWDDLTDRDSVLLDAHSFFQADPDAQDLSVSASAARISPTSPCRGTGVAVGGITTDYYGKPRSGTVDIGAVEFDAGAGGLIWGVGVGVGIGV